MHRRKLGQQVMEVGITGENTDEEARDEFRRVIAPLIRPDQLAERCSASPAGGQLLETGNRFAQNTRKALARRRTLYHVLSLLAARAMLRTRAKLMQSQPWRE